jgi:hypothetical protein
MAYIANWTVPDRVSPYFVLSIPFACIAFGKRNRRRRLEFRTRYKTLAECVHLK